MFLFVVLCVAHKSLEASCFQNPQVLDDHLGSPWGGGAFFNLRDWISKVEMI